MVRGRQTQRRLQLRGPPRGGGPRRQDEPLYFEGEPGDREAITYAELQRRIARAANGLLKLGVRKGDRVVIYLPLFPKPLFSRLRARDRRNSFARVRRVLGGGAEVPGGRHRREGSDHHRRQNRRGKVVPVKVNADEACSGENNIEHVIVVDRTSAADPVAHAQVPWTAGRDIWYHDLVDDQPDTHEYELHDAEDPLFIIIPLAPRANPRAWCTRWRGI